MIRYYWLGLFLVLFLPAMAQAAEARVFTLSGHELRLEIADDEVERQRGLMNRSQLAAKAGMLFLYEKTDRHLMWMKNTLIPLDMIFLDDTMRVVYIHAQAKPHDLTPIGQNAPPSKAIIELPGGSAADLAIQIGDQLAEVK